MNGNDQDEIIKLIAKANRQCMSFKAGKTLGSDGAPVAYRCTHKAVIVAIEVSPPDPGHLGTMTLCGECSLQLQRQQGPGFTINYQIQPDQEFK